MRYHLLCLLLCLCPAACRFLPAAKPAWNPRPLSTGSIGLQCLPGREVWCEQGDTQCDALKASVALVEASVPGLLVYAGEAPHDTLTSKLAGVLPEAGVVVVLRAPPQTDKYPPATTQAVPDKATGCLPNVPIVLLWPDNALDAASWQRVLLHELLHSLGAGHAAAEFPFSTLMHPNPNAENRQGLSVSDESWLRAVYGS
jgi:hypothetical protein